MNIYLLLPLIFITKFCQAPNDPAPLRIRSPIQDFFYKDLIICSFGASVTAQKDSIWDHFVKTLNEKTGRNHTHMKMGYGGEHIYPSATCFIDDIIRKQPDICIIDWFDTAYVRTNSTTKLCLETIIRKAMEINSYIIFYYHILKDGHNRSRTDFIDFVEKIALEYNVSSYHEDEALFLQQVNSFDDILRDNVHTTPYGSILLGNIFCDNFLLFPIKAVEVNNHVPDKNYLYDAHKIKITEKMITGKFSIDDDGYYVLNKNSSLALNLKGYLLGLAMKIGPYSPKTDILIDNEQPFTRSVWDPWCYYERRNLGLSVEKKILNTINISISETPPDYSKSHKEHDYSKYEKLLKVKEFFMCAIE